MHQYFRRTAAAMSNPSGPDHDEVTGPVAPAGDEQPAHEIDPATEVLRGIDRGQSRDGYVKYDEAASSETQARVAAARPSAVVASVAHAGVHGAHAEAKATSFLACAAATRSTGSVDVQFRDNPWKSCQ